MYELKIRYGNTCSTRLLVKNDLVLRYEARVDSLRGTSYLVFTCNYFRAVNGNKQ